MKMFRVCQLRTIDTHKNNHSQVLVLPIYIKLCRFTKHVLFIDETISPTSIGAYFENNGYECTPCKHTERTRKMMASHPVIHSEQTQGYTDSCDYNEFYEWLGAVACDIDW